MTTTAYEWLKQIPTSLLQEDSVPLAGFPPDFPWEQFSQELAKRFQLSGFKISPKASFELRSEPELLDGIGDAFISIPVTVAPMGGTLWWVMAREDLMFLMAKLLTQQTTVVPTLPVEFEDAFRTLLVMETIYAVSQVKFDKDISAQTLHPTPFHPGTSLCLDIAVSLPERTFWGRLVLSKELHQQWKERYAVRSLSVPLAEKLDLTLHLEAGRTIMSREEWSKVIPGDFLLLDRCSMQAPNQGRVKITSHGHPLFLGDLKEGKLQIQQYDHYQEGEIATMNEDAKEHDHEEEEEVEEEEVEGEEEIEGEEVEGEEEEEEGEEEEEEEGEFLEEAPQEKWPPPPEKRVKPTEAPSAAPPVQPAPVQAQPKVAATATVEKEEAKPFSLQELPLTITVEIGRIQMAFDKIMKLQPGNLLELNLSPESGVDLVVNGKRIGKGELLLIGEMLGVRILDIG